MPAISVDTFFACALMVILVLSAMATTSKLLYPHINSTIDNVLAVRYREISKYLILNEGTPSNWGQNGQIIPETFGLAKANSDIPYELDMDKVSRLNSENLYAISYPCIFTMLRMSDVFFKMEIKPIFDVAISLTATFSTANETNYQFEILTKKSGVPVQTELKWYAIAENYFETNYAYAPNGKAYINITISNNIEGQALLVALAKTTCHTKIVSYGVHSFAHNSTKLTPKNTFVRLSPLNYTVKASFVHSEINLSRLYALNINYYSVLEHIQSDSQSATYNLPHFIVQSPTVIVATGWNSTDFFAEWTAYPQIPLEIGANFASLETLSNVFAYNYVVSIDSALYECTVWLGGLKE